MVDLIINLDVTMLTVSLLQCKCAVISILVSIVLLVVLKPWSWFFLHCLGEIKHFINLEKKSIYVIDFLF